MSQAVNPLRPAVGAIIFAYGAWYFKDYQYTEYAIVPILLAFFAAVTAFSAVYNTLFFVLPQLWRYMRMWRTKNRVGSAGWAVPKDLRKAKFNRKSGFFVGTYNKRPVFCDIESSMLVVAPAGGGKTRDFVIPNLLYSKLNMIVIDLKGTLACITAKARQKYLKHNIIFLNPSNIYSTIIGKTACYNPLQILIDNWQTPKYHDRLFSDARAIIKQLAPDPKVHTDNQYFRNGSGKFLLFAIMRLVTTHDNPTLTKTLLLLSDLNALETELYEAACGDILSGDLARLATDIITKLETGDPKQIESFREGAVQALEDYSPSGALAHCTSRTDFRFFDLRKNNMTIYQMGDPATREIYERWIGLMSWCATTELMRHDTGKAVCFMGDEITNFRIVGLPSLLTLLREFNVILVLIVQELQEWANTYGDKSLETLLSQTEAKLMIGASGKTSELVSRELGERPQINLNYNMGTSFFNTISRSLSEGGRKLMTADEVRRSKKAILLYRKMKPVQIDMIGYHQISPLKRRADINPKFGKTYKGWTKLRL